MNTAGGRGLFAPEYPAPSRINGPRAVRSPGNTAHRADQPGARLSRISERPSGSAFLDSHHRAIRRGAFRAFFEGPAGRRGRASGPSPAPNSHTCFDFDVRKCRRVQSKRGAESVRPPSQVHDAARIPPGAWSSFQPPPACRECGACG